MGHYCDICYKTIKLKSKTKHIKNNDKSKKIVLQG